ncbi:hypothetical protein BegalDRAFT_0406 [Beggiatoa alba B18LD]|uniref:Uncharacterized protein n=1 Tax=Beggiatoa alba B18LD TaxID=395493 RepID=I3CCI2_9GAMM|nr:phospholipase D family protein [Beggiatoa alba]EIJ41325.1 hypothetical protein BegalDRAFT_0406 [Beggiatoa alba B18LD]
MAQFLDTKKAVSVISDLIKNAGERLILVSPYLKLSKDFRELLTYRDNVKREKTVIIFGKEELKQDERNFLQALRYLDLRYYADVHAKCYLNNDDMVITSLNLYEFSMMNNKEMGVLIQRARQVDEQVYDEAFREIEFIKSNSLPYVFPLTASSVTAQEVPKKEEQSTTLTGFCIRTGVKIPFNLEKPMSADAYKEWNKFNNPEYPEKFCHFSGESSNGETSVNRPILKKHWKKAKAQFNL